MSRRDNTSLLVRGVPRAVVAKLDAAARRASAEKNAIVLQLIRDYAGGAITPSAQPPPFDPNRTAAASHPGDTASLSISGIDPEVFSAFMARAKRDGWFSKNALIVQLLQDYQMQELTERP